MTTATAIEQDVYAAAFERLAAGRQTEPGELAELRRRAIERFGVLGFPTKRLEEWRSTDVGPIARSEFELDPTGEGVSATDIEHLAYGDVYEVVALEIGESGVQCD